MTNATAKRLAAAEREFHLVSRRLDAATGQDRSALLHQFDRALNLLAAARKAHESHKEN